MASNRKLSRLVRHKPRAAEFGTSTGSMRRGRHAHPGRRVRRVPLGLRATLNYHVRKAFGPAQGSGGRSSASVPRVLRIPRLRHVGPGCWPCRQAQRLVPVRWFTDRWTPRVQVRRAPVRRLPPPRLHVTFKYPQSLTTL